ncbi:MAG: cupredoxin domain-containing protein [Candidatus Kerfeldbacteria bacterium]|nr:cupredoxin domain-containing protein [Candidatus Kerfeldbacteria bacterium]
MGKVIWTVIIIVLIGFGVWYFVGTTSQNANENAAATNTTTTANTNAQQFLTTNKNENANQNVNQNANLNANANTNAATSQTGPDYSVSMTDYAFTPATITADLGKTVTVKVTNNGGLTHSFVINGLSVNSGLLAPGQSKTISITTPSSAGTFEYFCSVSGHKDLGMKGTLTVQQL